MVTTVGHPTVSLITASTAAAAQQKQQLKGLKYGITETGAQITVGPAVIKFASCSILFLGGTSGVR